MRTKQTDSGLLHRDMSLTVMKQNKKASGFFGTVVQIPLHKPLTCRYAYPEIVSLDALKACNAMY